DRRWCNWAEVVHGSKQKSIISDVAVGSGAGVVLELRALEVCPISLSRTAEEREDRMYGKVFAFLSVVALLIAESIFGSIASAQTSSEQTFSAHTSSAQTSSAVNGGKSAPL